MDIAISELRANLKAFVDRVKAGEEVTITERGLPVARLTPVNSVGLLARLEREGVISAPVNAKRTRAHDIKRAKTHGSVSEYVIRSRDEKR